MTDTPAPATPSTVRVTFGNPNPLDTRTHDDGSVTLVPSHLDVSTTTVELRAGYDDVDEGTLALTTDNDRYLTYIARSLDPSLRHYAVALLELDQIVDLHTGNLAPDWIVCPDDPQFEQLLGVHFVCPTADPTMLQTTVGRDAVHAQMFSSSQPAPFSYLAITASTTAPSASDTTLAGEISTAGGGLVRGLATYAHTTGTNTSTLTKTFTANANDSLPVSPAQSGQFNASSGGTLGWHTALSTVGPLNSSGDSLTVTANQAAG